MPIAFPGSDKNVKTIAILRGRERPDAAASIEDVDRSFPGVTTNPESLRRRRGGKVWRFRYLGIAAVIFLRTEMHESTESVEEMMAVRTIGRPGGELQLSLEYSILIVQLLHMVRILRT